MTNEEKLLNLGRETFPNLSVAEEKVIRAAAKGELADCRTRKNSDRDPANAAKWGRSRVVRAEVIRWLCADREATSLLDPSGIKVRYARIENKLKLSWVDIPFPLCLDLCVIGQEIKLLDAAVPMLSFQGSRTKSISAGGIVVKGSVLLRGVCAEGEARFVDARVGGQFACTGGTFRNLKSKDDPNAHALVADRIEVKGSVLLQKGFAAEGKVRFLGATVGGSLTCTGGTFRNPKSKDDAKASALSADRIVVKGSIFLDEGFAAEGKVRFLAATVGGSLTCTGGTFRNPKSKDDAEAAALSADRIDVKGGVFLDEGFAAEGKVRFLGATVGGSLTCTGGTFTNPKSKDDAKASALSADGIVVKGSVFLRGVCAEGEVCFTGGTVGREFACTGGTFRNLKSKDDPNADALSANRIVVKGSIFLNEGFVAEGKVRFLGATVGGSLACSRGTFRNPKSKDDAQATALSADGIDVKGNVFLRQGFAAEGKVRLLGATIGGELTCTGGTFRNLKSKDDPEASALSADRIVVKGSLFLNEGFAAEGKVRFLGATVRGSLTCTGGTFRNPKSKDDAKATALSADGIDVKGDVSLRQGFAAEGKVRLVGATIGGDLTCAGGTFTNLSTRDDAGAIALSAGGIRVKGRVLLCHGFAAEGEVRLRGATVDGNLDCTDGTFTNPKSKYDPEPKALRADGIEVKGDVLLHEGFAAEGEVALPGASIRGDLVCSNARFDNPSGDALWLEGAEVGKRLIVCDDFRLAGKLSLAGARARELWDDEQSWPKPGMLNLHGFVYDAIHTASPTGARARLKWLHLQDPERFSFQPYEQLASVLRDSGQNADAQKVLIAREWDRRKYGGLAVPGQIANWILWFFIGYGYRVRRALYWAGVFLIVGTVLFARGSSSGVMVCAKGVQAPARMQPPGNPATQQTLKPPGEQTFNAWAYSLDALVPVVNLHQEEYWLPNPATQWGWWLRVYLWVHIGMGWFLTTLAILGLTGIVRR